jgi:hypothetical protein
MVESLQARFGYRVIPKWHGGRKYAAKGLIKQNQLWIKYNFFKILGIENWRC